jgi:hypothetical protein
MSQRRRQNTALRSNPIAIGPIAIGPIAIGRSEMSTFAGVWNITISTPIGELKVVFDITEEGGAIQGTARSDDETVEFLNPVADGNRLTWSQDVTTPMKLSLNFDVTVDGDTMSGTSKPPGFPSSKVVGSRG